MFAPCNIPLDRLIEEHKEDMQRGLARRQDAMNRAAMKPHVADAIRRRETAVLLSLQRLQQLENSQP